MIARFASLLVTLRYVAWLVILPVGAALWYYAPPIQFDQTVEGFFPPDDPALARYELSKKSFDGDQIVFIAFDEPHLWTPEGMDRVRALADQVAAVKGVVRVDALDKMPVPWRLDEAVESLAAESFSFRTLTKIAQARDDVRSVLERLSNKPERSREFQERVKAHPMFQGLFVDAKGTATGLMLELEHPKDANHREIIAELRRICDEFAALEWQDRDKIGHIAIAGPPVLVADGFTSLDRDNQVLGTAAVILMGITMLIAVRNPVWALLPIVAGLVTWQLAKALIVWFDLRLTLSSGPIVAQTVVLCMPAASHLVTHFYDRMYAGESRRRAAVATLSSLTAPITWCSLTAAAGYLATWAMAAVRPAAQFGVTMAICSLTAGIVTLFLAPGAMSLVLRHRAVANPNHKQILARTRSGLINSAAIAHPRATVLTFAIPALLLITGMLALQFESNYINSFKKDSRAAVDYRFVESRMGGVGLLELLYTAPEEVTVDWVEKVHHTAEQLHAIDPGVITSVLSLGDVLAPTKGAAKPAEGEGEDAADPQYVVDLKVRMLSTPSYSHILDNFWNQENGVMRILVRIRDDTPAERKEAIFHEMVALTRSEISDDAFLTGLSHLMTQVTRSLIGLSFRSTLLSAAMIFLMLWIALRSARLAILAQLPTLLAVGSVLGLMGLIGLKIDVSTAVVASIAIGLSVDDSFHCLLRWKRERDAGLSPLDAVAASFSATAPAVILSSSAVSLGFLAMVFSDFVPMVNFGWLISVATLGGSLGNLLFVPSVLRIAARRQQRNENAAVSAAESAPVGGE